MQPALYGGHEYGFDALVRVAAPVAAACGSTGWIFSLGMIHQWLVATFPKQAQDEYWDDQDTIAAGSYAPIGKMTPVSGGYRLTGKWTFTSGCDHAQWLLLGGMIPSANEGGAPQPAFILVPARDVSIEDDWFTMGLAGTGSKSTVASDVFVPTHRTVPFSQVLVGTSPGASVHRNPLYRHSMLSAYPFGLVAPVLGMAEGALAEFVDMAKVRSTRGAVAGGNSRMAEFATVQSRVAEATGSIDAARLLIFDALEKAALVADQGQQVDSDRRLRNRLSQAFSVKLLIQAIDVLFLASGGQGIFVSKPLQRMWRDAHAAAVHVSLNWDAVSTTTASTLSALSPQVNTDAK